MKIKLKDKIKIISVKNVIKKTDKIFLGIELNCYPNKDRSFDLSDFFNILIENNVLSEKECINIFLKYTTEITNFLLETDLEFSNQIHCFYELLNQLDKTLKKFLPDALYNFWLRYWNNLEV